MFFLLSKVLGVMVSPFLWICILLLCRLFFRSSKWRNVLLLIAVLLFVIFSNPLLFRWTINSWEAAPESMEEVTKKADYVVVLGGMSTYYAEAERVRFFQSADRLFQAIDLYQNGGVENIIISGGTSKILHKEKPEAIFLKDYLMKIGVAADAIVIDSLSRNTHENAVCTRQLFDENGWKRKIVLVTSAFHMPRASRCFIKEGFEVVCYNTDFLRSSSPISFCESFIPSVSTLSTWELLIKEWIGLFVYALKGYV
ncbi:YdcF family protein [Marinilabiliaceae bacterium JC017]|nr:YdcF family protein [Marinilabiliaceae bacterium JC017]